MAENYPPKLAKTLAKLMAADDPDDMYVYDDILAGNDASEEGEGKKAADDEGHDKDKDEFICLLIAAISDSTKLVLLISAKTVLKRLS